MKINRREFLLLTAVFAAGCGSAAADASHKDQVVNAGAIANYAADGVYSKFIYRGFFIVRRGEKLFALSAICTHQKCRLIAEPDRSFYCKCHGSKFDAKGKVTLGPAKRDLPELQTSVNERGELLVNVPAV